MKIKFIDGPLDGQTRDIAFPPIEFQNGLELDADDNPVGWPNVPDEIGHYELYSFFESESLDYEIFVWVPFMDVPGCLKPMDSIIFAATVII